MKRTILIFLDSLVNVIRDKVCKNKIPYNLYARRYCISNDIS